jgi:CBS domain-containing protein
LKDSLSFFIVTVKAAETVDDLRICYIRLQRFIKPLINSEISIKYITNITSAFSDTVTKRLIELAIKDLGQPPVKFSFICLGSEGRREETLLTDQDNAIIYDDAPKGKEKAVSEYFNTLGERVCNSLNLIGYSFCRGNIMAKNPKWCQPYSVWEDYFSDWITTPEPQNLLEASIFFDLRNIYGADEQTARLRVMIFDLIKANPVFLYHLAYNTYLTKVPHVTSGNIITDKTTDLLDLKTAVSLITMFTRTYALQSKISATGTLERLEALKARNIISEDTIEELVFGFNYLMKLRLKNQTHLSDKNLQLSNSLNPKKLIDIEFSFLKKVLSLLPIYQNKIKTDFRITT